MALVVDISKEKLGFPWDYGLKDWHHNAQGQVDYPWIHDSREKVEPVEFEGREKQRYKDVCSDAALDNFTTERERYANRCVGFREYEKWLEEWN